MPLYGNSPENNVHQGRADGGYHGVSSDWVNKMMANYKANSVSRVVGELKKDPNAVTTGPRGGQTVRSMDGKGQSALYDKVDSGTLDVKATKAASSNAATRHSERLAKSAARNEKAISDLHSKGGEFNDNAAYKRMILGTKIESARSPNPSGSVSKKDLKFVGDAKTWAAMNKDVLDYRKEKLGAEAKAHEAQKAMDARREDWRAAQEKANAEHRARISGGAKAGSLNEKKMVREAVAAKVSPKGKPTPGDIAAKKLIAAASAGGTRGAAAAAALKSKTPINVEKSAAIASAAKALISGSKPTFTSGAKPSREVSKAKTSKAVVSASKAAVASKAKALREASQAKTAKTVAKKAAPAKTAPAPRQRQVAKAKVSKPRDRSAAAKKAWATRKANAAKKGGTAKGGRK